MGNLLTPFKKFLSNKNTVTIIGVLLGIVVLYVGYTWRVNQSISPKRVPYATQTLVSGQEITEEMIGYTEIPNDTLKSMSNLVTDVNNIRTKLVSYDSKIPQNGFFFTENLIDPEDMPDSVFSKIKDGYTIFALSVDNDSTYGNSIFPDDTIDLYLTAKDENDLLIFGRFIKSIQVLAVKDSDGNNVFSNSADTKEPAVLLFAVPEDLFLLLSKANKLDGIEINPVPRNSSYSKNPAATEVESDYLKDFVITKTVTIPNECTDLTKC